MNLRPFLMLAPLALLAGCGGQPQSLISAASTSVAGQTTSASSGPGSTSSTTSTSSNNVSNTGSPQPSIPGNATTLNDIQKIPNWENCTTCAGGATAVYSQTVGVSSPSLSGGSAQFSLLSGTAPWGQALWWKYLAADNSATHFVYELSFYMDNPTAAQALEFGVSQSTGANRYEFSTQCDMQGDHTWRVWNPTAHSWSSTGAPCPAPAANTWNHLIWELERDASDQVIFTAVTLNGSRTVVNMTMSHQSDSSSGIDISFQMDARSGPTLYSVWLDQMKLSYW